MYTSFLEATKVDNRDMHIIVRCNNHGEILRYLINMPIIMNLHVTKGPIMEIDIVNVNIFHFQKKLNVYLYVRKIK